MAAKPRRSRGERLPISWGMRLTCAQGRCNSSACWALSRERDAKKSHSFCPGPDALCTLLFSILDLVCFLVSLSCCIELFILSKTPWRVSRVTGAAFRFVWVSQHAALSLSHVTNHSSNTQDHTHCRGICLLLFSLAPHPRVPVPPHQHHALHAPRSSTQHTHTAHESRESHVTRAHIHTHPDSPDSTLRCMLR